MIIQMLAACASTSSPGHTLTVTTTPPSNAGAKTRVWAFSDANLVHPAAQYASDLAVRKTELCTTAERGSPAVTLDQAISKLNAVLTQAAGAGSLDKLARTKVGSDPAQAETVAAALIGKANAGGALAALLLAHKEEPTDPRHLENAGVMAASAGYPQEALALLVAAERLQPVDPGMGLDYQAIELNNRGYALIRLGSYTDAVPLLQTAISREPLLDEAQRNLAVALTCMGQLDQAGAAMRAGLRRNHFDDLGDPTKTVSYDPSQVFDLSQGQPTKLPDVTYPLTLDQDAGAVDKFDSDYQDRYQQSRQAMAAAQTAYGTVQLRNPLSLRRMSSIFQLAGNPSGTANLARLFSAWQTKYKEVADTNQAWTDAYGNQNTVCSAPGTDFTKCFQDWCTAAAPAAQRNWYTQIKDLDTALRAWADAYSRYASGLASNLKDPGAHQWVLLEEQHQLMLNYSLHLQLAHTWIFDMSLGKGTCFDVVTDSPAETNAGGKPSAVDCSSLIGGANISIDLELFSINVSCEEVGFEAEAPAVEGGFADAGIFASVSYKFKNGSTTLFAGDYAKTREIGGLSASAHGGGYITWDHSGQVTDCGVRGETSIDQSKGPVSSSVSGPEVHWSFVGAADDAE
ncbi:MAG TPA: hypothetical protein VI384_00575 [Candidatus Dormibacteraeota bacterium]